MNKMFSTQEWLPFEEIFENGIILLKNNNLIKILKITPVNFNLKSNLEKESILNSYKVFLKTCNFDIQILIQSNKEDLTKHILKIEEETEKETETIKIISKEYISFIKKLNKEKKSSSKNFFIILQERIENKKGNTDDLNKILFEKLNDNYFKIKECLSRCGNLVFAIKDKEECERIFNSFLNTRKDLA